jgi:hypothetical protein
VFDDPSGGGRGKLRAGGEGLTATQHLAVDRIAFAWRARFPVLPWLAVTVFDGSADGDGRLEVKMLGRTLQREQGPEVTRGEALRYLAELPLVPYAMAHNAEIEWRELDGRRVELSGRAGPDPVAVTVEFDDAGDIVRASTPARGYRRGDAWVPTPWSGRIISAVALDTPFASWRR